MKKIGYLGAGVWGFSLASLLASKGYEVISWTRDPILAAQLNETRIHPHLPGHLIEGNVRFTTDLREAIFDKDLIVESITSSGLRSVCKQMRDLDFVPTPLVITSKGIEQKSGLILPEVAVEVLGEAMQPLIGFLSGPSYAQEVVRGLPASVIGTAFNPDIIQLVCEAFKTPAFRVYPNSDIMGVAFGGALKNVIAIACGISEGLGLGHGSKAALMTRGLHEIRKLAIQKGCKSDTINGLAGMGDLCLTCGSLISRNCRFGYLLAEGLTTEEALAKIGMVVEGMYTCVSALEIGRQYDVALPITETVYKIIYEGMRPMDAVQALMARTVKEEHL